MVRLLFLCAVLFVGGQCANILFFSATPSVSHQVMFQPVWRELSKRGHNVVAVTPNPLNDTTLTNLTEVDLGFLYDMMKVYMPKDVQTYIMKKPNFLMVFLKDAVMTRLFNEMNRQVLRSENVQDFLHHGYKFDVVIVEWLYPTFAALGPYFDAPIIGITSLGAPIPALDTVGNPSHPVYAPDHNLPVGRTMSFRERLMSALWAVYVRIFYHLVVLPREDQLAREYLGKDLPYLGDIERNISLLLLNRNPVFHRIMPVVPAIIELGYTKQNKTLKPLKPDLQKFVDNSKNGFIYFSLGSNMKANFLPNATLQAIFDALADIPYDVIFKWNGEELKNIPKNIFLVDWVSQATLLGHKKIKLFITQGGLQSSDEAIINQVPIIGIPFAHDQTSNVDTFVNYGVGKMIDAEEITAEKLKSLILEVITDSSYKENAIKLSQLYTDQPKDGLEKAIWWIEYVIRHKGAAHLRSPSMDLPWYQYLMLDIAIFITAVIIIILGLLYLLLKITCGLFKKIFSKKKTKKD